MSVAQEFKKFSKTELHPNVVVAGNDEARFIVFCEAIEAQGFSCTFVNNHNDLLVFAAQSPGTIVFLSWNLKNSDNKKLAKLISNKLATVCFLFAENDDIQTAALLSSSGHDRTIQQPYNEKNFVMAIKKVCADRNEEHQRAIRKEKHINKMKKKSNHEDSSELEVAKVLLFKTESAEESMDSAELYEGPGASNSKAEIMPGAVNADGDGPYTVHVCRESIKAQLWSGTKQKNTFFHLTKERETSKKMFSSKTEEKTSHTFPEQKGSKNREKLSPDITKKNDQSVLASPSAGKTSQAPNDNRPIPLPHSWMEDSSEAGIQGVNASDEEGPMHVKSKNPSGVQEESSDSELSRMEFFWMVVAIVLGLFLCVALLAHVFISG